MRPSLRRGGAWRLWRGTQQPRACCGRCGRRAARWGSPTIEVAQRCAVCSRRAPSRTRSSCMQTLLTAQCSQMQEPLFGGLLPCQEQCPPGTGLRVLVWYRAGSAENAVPLDTVRLPVRQAQRRRGAAVRGLIMLIVGLAGTERTAYCLSRRIRQAAPRRARGCVRDDHMH